MRFLTFCAPIMPRSATTQISTTPKHSLKRVAIGPMVAESLVLPGHMGQARGLPYPSVITPTTISA